MGFSVRSGIHLAVRSYIVHTALFLASCSTALSRSFFCFGATCTFFGACSAAWSRCLLSRSGSFQSSGRSLFCRNRGFLRFLGTTANHACSGKKTGDTQSCKDFFDILPVHIHLLFPQDLCSLSKTDSMRIFQKNTTISARSMTVVSFIEKSYQPRDILSSQSGVHEIPEACCVDAGSLISARRGAHLFRKLCEHILKWYRVSSGHLFESVPFRNGVGPQPLCKSNSDTVGHSGN